MSLEQDRNLQEKQSLAILAGEILRDAQKLFDQQVTLTKLQLLEDLASAKPFAVWLVVGLLTLVVASIVSGFTLVYLLKEFTELSLWACFAIVDLLCILIMAISIWIVRAKLKDRSLLNG